MLINALLEKIFISDLQYLEHFWEALSFVIKMKEGETKILLLQVEVEDDESKDAYNIFLSEEEKNKDPGEFILSSLLTRNIPQIKVMCLKYIFEIFKRIVKPKYTGKVAKLSYH